ncbi:sugar kinase [Halolactibacillus miurensis]|uniref:Fructokinase n=1 Tax=Halolactibacillus miurensis TaxID=306541 RepID=A0A1I6URB5_9BACI|nr:MULTISPECIES: sugar kinase [Halolactibacillus]GEM05466.1 sugar kinase [Halolactibacillus miurensis]SFT03874.1 fructokinase [Halolactibacillus miurensis]
MIKLNQPFTLKQAPVDVLSIGEILIDMISDSYHSLTENNGFHAFFGGSPANLCMNINRLGGEARLVAAVGDDRFGDFLIHHLEKESVDTTLIQRTDKSTSMVVVNKSKGSPTPIFYRGSDFDIRLTDELEQAIRNTKIMHISSWPLSKSSSRKVVYDAVKIAKEAEVLVGFDPNYHPGLWDEDEDGIQIMKEMISQADIVKPSEDDAFRLFGDDSPENHIEKFHALGCPIVLMTLGKDGAIASFDGEKTYYKTKATKVVDTTGAGDAFWSGFYTGITQGKTVEQALDLGFSTSAYKLQFTGAVVKLPHYEEFLDKEPHL